MKKSQIKKVIIIIVCLLFISGCVNTRNWPKVKYVVDNKDKYFDGGASGHYEVSTKDKVLGNAAIIYKEEKRIVTDKEIKETYGMKFTKQDALKIAKTFDKYGGGMIKTHFILGPPQKEYLSIYKYTNAKSSDEDNYILWNDLTDKKGHNLTIAWYKGKELRVFIR